MGNFDFSDDFSTILKGIEEESRIEAAKPKYETYYKHNNVHSLRELSVVLERSFSGR